MMIYSSIVTALMIFFVIFSIIQRKKYINMRNIYEDDMDVVDENWDILNQLFIDLTNQVIRTYLEMKLVDKGGSFQSDDEVGFAFSRIKHAISKLKDILKHIAEKSGLPENNFVHIPEEGEVEDQRKTKKED